MKQWETDVEEWLKKKNIPLDIKEFKRLYNKDRKSRLAKKEEEDDEWNDQDIITNNEYKIKLMRVDAQILLSIFYRITVNQERKSELSQF